MGRSLPKLIALLSIAAVVAAIYVVSRRSAPPPQQPGIVYVNPNAGALSEPAPATPPAR